MNAQVDAARAQVIQSVPADQQGPYLAQLEAYRAQANAEIDRAIAACG